MRGIIIFNIFNISSGKNIQLNYMIKEIEQNLNLKSKKKYLNIQKGDVKDTLSSNQKIRKILKIKKFTPFKKGIFTIYNLVQKVL